MSDNNPGVDVEKIVRHWIEHQMMISIQCWYYINQNHTDGPYF
jgi:hypothetical protein